MNRSDLWLKNYNIVKEYYNIHGNLDVPRNYIIDNLNIYRWLARQKNVYKNDGLSNERISMLNNLGIVWDIRDDIWNETYILLKEYHSINGNIDIPFNYTYKGVNLYCWLNNQRMAYKSGKLCKDKMDLLNILGVKWSKNEYKWNYAYNLLKEYHRIHGNIDVPVDYTIDNINLYNFLDCQRRAYKGKGHNKITDKQITMLNILGMKWDKWESNWINNYNLLKEYYNEYGTTNLPPRFIFKGVKLDNWLNVQKRLYKKGLLSDDKIIKLNQLRIKWDRRLETWERNYNLLKKYYQKYKTANIPQSYTVGDVRLGAWLNNQRASYNGFGSTKITLEHIKLLNELNVDWVTTDTRFLNNNIYDMKVYNVTLFKRTNFVLRDMVFEGINEINQDNQKEIESELIKRIWR